MNFSSISTVLAPLDLEDPAPEIVRLAIEVAGDPADVHVIYVLPMLEPSLMARIDDKHRVRHATEALQTWLVDEGFPDTVRTHVKVGDAAHVTEALIGELGAELVVLRSHGRTGVRRLLLGSVAERIARLARCPVLLLKAEED